MRTDVEITEELRQQLGAAFLPTEIEFKPGATADGRALALAFADARVIQTRLDKVVGPSNWAFDYEVVGSEPGTVRVKGALTIYGVTKCDAGEAKKEDEPLKSAVSDALKRCAVAWGVGRFLYGLPAAWFPYDQQKRRWIEPPQVSRAAINAALEACGIKPLPQEVAKERVEAALSESGKAGRPPLRVEKGGAVTNDGHAVDAATGELATSPDEMKAADQALLQAFADADLNPRLPGLMRVIAEKALGREVPVFRNLGPDPRRQIAAWVTANREAAQGISTDVQAALETKAG